MLQNTQANVFRPTRSQGLKMCIATIL